MSTTIEVIDHTDEVLSELDTAINKALELIGQRAERHAKIDYVPVDTGRLKGSISHASDGEWAYIGTNVEYAPYVEMGTSRQRAQPYLRPAIANHIDEYKKIAEFCLKGDL